VSLSDEFAAGLTLMLEQIAPVKEAAQGYREQLRRDGWSEGASEGMAMELHNHLIATIFAKMGGSR